MGRSRRRAGGGVPGEGAAASMGNLSTVSKHLKGAATERMSRGYSISSMSEADIEDMDREKAMNGLAADLVMLFPIESEEILRAEANTGEEPSKDFIGKMRQRYYRVKLKTKVNETVLKKLQERQEQRAQERASHGARGTAGVPRQRS